MISFSILVCAIISECFSYSKSILISGTLSFTKISGNSFLEIDFSKLLFFTGELLLT
jgi:hypothetical protein